MLTARARRPRTRPWVTRARHRFRAMIAQRCHRFRATRATRGVQGLAGAKEASRSAALNDFSMTRARTLEHPSMAAFHTLMVPPSTPHSVAAAAKACLQGRRPARRTCPSHRLTWPWHAGGKPVAPAGFSACRAPGRRIMTVQGVGPLWAWALYGPGRWKFRHWRPHVHIHCGCLAVVLARSCGRRLWDHFSAGLHDIGTAHLSIASCDCIVVVSPRMSERHNSCTFMPTSHDARSR